MALRRKINAATRKTIADICMNSSGITAEQQEARNAKYEWKGQQELQ